jgi:hypothetical protein
MCGVFIFKYGLCVCLGIDLLIKVSFTEFCMEQPFEVVKRVDIFDCKSVRNLVVIC